MTGSKKGQLILKCPFDVFGGFLGDLMTPKGHFEIKWPLVLTVSFVHREWNFLFTLKHSYVHNKTATFYYTAKF